MSGISPGRYTEEPRVRESLDRMITENRKTPDRMLLCRVNAKDKYTDHSKWSELSTFRHYWPFLKPKVRY